MTIIRKFWNNGLGCTETERAVLRDPNLTLEQKGLFAILQTFKESNVSVEEIEAFCFENGAMIKEAYLELKNNSEYFQYLREGAENARG